MFVRRSCSALRSSVLFSQIRHYPADQSIKLIDSINDALENETYKPKDHPGRVRLPLVSVPDRIAKAVKICIEDKDKKMLLDKAHSLDRQIHHRKMVLEKDEHKAKLRVYQNKLLKDAGLKKFEDLEESVSNPNAARRAVEQKAQELFWKDTNYHWKALVVNENKALEYLLGRGAREYAAIMKIFREIKQRDPDFKPQSFFDFGAGVGTGTWAAAECWRDSLFEYFSVDHSAAMNDLSELILRDGRDNKAMSLKGVYYRQFLPESSEYKSHLVLSAFTLSDLPDAQTRMEKLLTLWNKCDGYLVLVENGTANGFPLINEARDFLMQQITFGEEEAHIFAPCPHEKACPRFFDWSKNRTCKSFVKYHPLRIGETRNEGWISYSYVVFKKGPRSNDATINWPRLVQPTRVAGKHTRCRACTHYGKLHEFIVTKKAHSTYTYRCARKSQWGDRLPIEFDEPVDEGEGDWSDVEDDDIDNITEK